ncbi:MAG: DoxX family protein [Myxococcota bacterium]
MTEVEGTAEVDKKRIIAYWVLTGMVVAAESGAGFSMLTGAEGPVEGLGRLGYPLYFLTILGSFKIAGVITLVAPKLPRLKEWAYAGFAFDFIGAAASHILNGDGINKIAPPLVILSVLIGSYLLRPSERRLV